MSASAAERLAKKVPIEETALPSLPINPPKKSKEAKSASGARECAPGNSRHSSKSTCAGQHLSRTCDATDVRGIPLPLFAGVRRRLPEAAGTGPRAPPYNYCRAKKGATGSRRRAVLVEIPLGPLTRTFAAHARCLLLALSGPCAGARRSLLVTHSGHLLLTPRRAPVAPSLPVLRS